MKEINKKTLIEALSSLKEHEPPQSVWERIEVDEALRKDLESAGLQPGDLPVYEPPVDVWENIESRLPQQGRLVSMRITWLKVAGMAATVAALLALTLWLWQPAGAGGEEPFEVTYATEAIDDRLLAADWDEDEHAFQRFQELCETKRSVCTHPEFQILQRELDELTDAKEMIKSAMGDYGATPMLISQIKDIELERSDLLKRMIVMMI